MKSLWDDALEDYTDDLLGGVQVDARMRLLKSSGT